MTDTKKLSGAGGTTGGIGEFLLGFVLAIAGGYLLTNQITVATGMWSFYGVNAFGLTLIPFLISVTLLFLNGKSPLGWLLLLASIAIVLAGVLMNLTVYFRPTSLFNTLMILALLAAGVGLILRSLRAH